MTEFIKRPGVIRQAVELPDGYRRVFSGLVREGDMRLNNTLLSDGIISFEPIGDMAFEQRPDNWYRYVSVYAMVVRPEWSPNKGDEGKACTRCQCQGCEPGWRYCDDCGAAVKRERLNA